MKLKQVLMASSAMLMLATPYLPVQAQGIAAARIDVAQAVPPALSGAIQTYLEARAALQGAEAAGEEDTTAAAQHLSAAEGELSALCAAIGQPDIEACIALAQSGGFETPAPQPEAVPEPEPQPEPIAEPTPEPEPEVVPPAPEPEPEVAPEPEPAPQPAPEPEPQPAPQPEPEPQPAPAPEPEPEPQPAPVEPPAAEEPAPAPAPVEEEAPAPVDEAPAPVEAPQQPAETPVEQPPAQEPAPTAAPGPLVDAVDAYRQAVADYEAALASGGDVDAAADALAGAEAELRDICATVGLTDLDTCLATFGIELEIVAPDGQTPAATLPAPEETGEQPVVEEEQPVEDEEELRDDILLDGDVQGEIVPEDVDVDEVAPLLDSEKDAAAEEARGETGTAVEAEGEAEADVEAETTPAPVEETAQTAPPVSDAEAQPDVDVEQIEAITAEEGTRRETAPLTAEQQGAELVGPVERPSNMELITTIGLATVFAIGANYFIDSLDTPRIIEDNYRDYWVEDLPGGRTREVIVRPDGTQLVTIRDRYGDIVRRSRIERDGREILLVYVDDSYRRYDEQGRWIDPGRQLPPLRLNIPAREYVLDASHANEQRVASFLGQPPVETLERYYTIEEVKRSSRLRDMVRRLEIGDLTFATASADIGQDQVATLSAVANAMLDLIAANPAETFLIEGHTDAVGADLYNLELSNRRAESIAYALTRVYGIPPENLATQGYGERYLKINTQAAEQLNRRVTIRRITPLVTPVGSMG